MIDLDKLSYKAYGNLMMILLTTIAILFNLFPFCLIGLVLCLVQIPIYLFARYKFKDPIHAYGLNICFVATLLFYILLFICIKGMLSLVYLPITAVFSIILNILGCYTTSTVPRLLEYNGKLFFGYKRHDESKYQKLLEYIKFNGLNEELIQAENRLKEIDSAMYLVYKRKFRDNKTFKEINEEFELENPRIVELLDKAYFYIIGALKI